MEYILKNLKPSLVWKYFEDICRIPHPSKKEEKIAAFLMDFAKTHNLEAKQDKAGNVLIKKPATKGYENRKTIVLQSHMDMVAEKNKEKVFDFDKDPIQPVIDGEWVRADGTTLGADDGIGVATELAILVENSIEHGPIECLFTVDEETGLTGAFALQEGFMSGDILINLDSEDEGEIFIGCAGGGDTKAIFSYKEEPVSADHEAYIITVKGLIGGHSGDEIHKGRGNSNKILNRFLFEATKKFDIELSHIEGGDKHNAIPREASAVITISKDKAPQLNEMFDKLHAEIKNEISIQEPNFKAILEKTAMPSNVLDKKTQLNLIRALYACPHGVIAMSEKLPGLVETSTNLASVKMQPEQKIVIGTSQRSSIESSKQDAMNMVENVFELAGAKTFHSDGYPGWDPNPNSEILKIAVEEYKKLFKKEPIVRAIHAGLECGLFLEKYPCMDMVSIGPTLRLVHTPEEKIEIATVDKFWKHTLAILKNVPVK
ncbi:MAG: aminoacyl-histidine dipeptidase [Bacteroidales bacterium]|jgi:dipeptidase D|nr:aminoacyl-histidine dipeptidase [Bacteroidales bacterium]